MMLVDLVLAIFRFFFGIESVGVHWPLEREYRFQHGPLLYLNALAFEIFVELGNAVNL